MPWEREPKLPFSSRGEALRKAGHRSLLVFDPGWPLGSWNVALCKWFQTPCCSRIPNLCFLCLSGVYSWWQWINETNFLLPIPNSLTILQKKEKEKKSISFSSKDIHLLLKCISTVIWDGECLFQLGSHLYILAMTTLLLNTVVFTSYLTPSIL